MYDVEKEKEIIWTYALITGIMISLNMSAYLWPAMKVQEIMKNDINIPAIKYANEALITLLVGAFASLALSLLALIIPKTNACKTLENLKEPKNRYFCIILAVILHALTFYNEVSSFISAHDLLIKSGMSIF